MTTHEQDDFDRLVKLARTEVDRVCSIYRSVGEAMTDESRNRMSCAFASIIQKLPYALWSLTEHVAMFEGEHFGGVVVGREALRSIGIFTESERQRYKERDEAEMLERYERERDQHEIRMTDDPLYAKWYRNWEKNRDVMENGINEP